MRNLLESRVCLVRGAFPPFVCTRRLCYPTIEASCGEATITLCLFAATLR
jgi:hypothetical protein